MTTIAVGKHTIRIEEDLLFFELVGELSLEEINRYILVAEELQRQRGPFYIIDDASRLGGADAAVRKRVATWLMQSSCRGVALHGTSITSRTLAMLVVGVMRMLGTKLVPITFFKTEEDARAWVETLRNKPGN